MFLFESIILVLLTQTKAVNNPKHNLVATKYLHSNLTGNKTIGCLNISLLKYIEYS